MVYLLDSKYQNVENNSNIRDECIWKPPIKRKSGIKSDHIKFPCRYPDKEKTMENCLPCLLGDLFAMNYTQLASIKAQAGMNEEIMTYLRSITSDDDLQDLR